MGASEEERALEPAQQVSTGPSEYSTPKSIGSFCRQEAIDTAAWSWICENSLGRKSGNGVSVDLELRELAAHILVKTKLSALPFDLKITLLLGSLTSELSVLVWLENRKAFEYSNNVANTCIAYILLTYKRIFF